MYDSYGKLDNITVSSADPAREKFTDIVANTSILKSGDSYLEVLGDSKGGADGLYVVHRDRILISNNAFAENEGYYLSVVDHEVIHRKQWYKIRSLSAAERKIYYTPRASALRERFKILSLKTSLSII